MRSVRIWGAVLAAVWVVPACTSDANDVVRPVADGPASSTTTAAPEQAGGPPTSAEPMTAEPTTTAQQAVDPVRAEVETAYRNAVQAFIDASAIPDPAFPALAEWTTGAMLEGWTNDLAAMRIQGRRTRFPENSVFEIRMEAMAQRDERSVLLETCERDDGIVFEHLTGMVVNDAVTIRRKRSLVELVGGAWRLSAREDLGDEAGAACFG